MSKLQDYDFHKVPQPIVDFKDDVREILNNGKLQFSFVSSVPGWAANIGELAFFSATTSTDNRIYVRASTATWIMFAGSGVPISGVLFSSTANASVSNTTAEGSLVGAGIGTTTIASSSLTVGRTLRITATGFYSTAAAPGTLRIRARMNGIAVLDTTADTPSGSLSVQYWRLDGLLTCQTTGATGTLMGQGEFRNSTSPTGSNLWEMVTNGTITINTNSGQILDVSAQWQTADASNGITGTNVVFELLN